MSDPSLLVVAEVHGLVGREGEPDDTALRARYATPHYRWFRDQVGELLARPSDVVVHHVSATIHVRDPNPPDPGLFG